MFQDQLWGPLTARRKSRSFKQLPCLLQPLPALTGSELPSPRAFSFGSIPSLSIPLPAHPPPAAGPLARPSIQGAPCLSVTGRRAFTLHPSGNEVLAIYSWNGLYGFSLSFGGDYPLGVQELHTKALTTPIVGEKNIPHPAPIGFIQTL